MKISRHAPELFSSGEMCWCPGAVGGVHDTKTGCDWAAGTLCFKSLTGQLF
jgi:hypothetical protein